MISQPTEQKLQIVLNCSVFMATSLKGTFSIKAPVGQVEIHNPHDSQVVSVRDCFMLGATKVSYPRFINPRAFAPTTSLQILIHLAHKIHLLLSISIYGCEKSTSYSLNSPA